LSKIRNKVRKLWVCLDGDVGSREISALCRTFLRLGIEVWRIDLPPGKDPDDLREEFNFYFDEAYQVRL
jgi:DNA primase